MVSTLDSIFGINLKQKNRQNKLMDEAATIFFNEQMISNWLCLQTIALVVAISYFNIYNKSSLVKSLFL